MSTITRNFVADHVAGIPRSGIRDFFDIVQRMPEAISLGVGEPDFVTPWRIREASQFALERGATSYTSNRGLLKLRQAVSGYVARGFGVTYDPDTEILITVGVSEALDLAVPPPSLADLRSDWTRLHHPPRCPRRFLPTRQRWLRPWGDG